MLPYAIYRCICQLTVEVIINSYSSLLVLLESIQMSNTFFCNRDTIVTVMASILEVVLSLELNCASHLLL